MRGIVQAFPGRLAVAACHRRYGLGFLEVPAMRTIDRHAFTLLELLIVIFIIAIVSVVALPTIIPAMNHRQASEAARIVQGALVGARDKAIHNGRPSGIRLMPDPAFQTIVTDPKNPFFGFIDPTAILASNRIIPLDPAPDYSEGLVNVDFSPPLAKFLVPYPGQGGGN